MTRIAAQGSLTGEVVAELAPHVPPLACCRAALLEGMGCAGGMAGSGRLVTARMAAARAAIQALGADGVRARVVRLRTPRRPRWEVVVQPGSGPPGIPSQRNCCARSRLRGAFLVAGTVSRPDAAPHLEVGSATEAGARGLAASAGQLEVAVSVLRRRGAWVVAARSVESVAALLSSIGAQHGRLRFEEGRVVAEMRASVNRRLNSETANLRRTVAAGVRQAAAIAALREDERRWESLPPALREAALLRQRHPQDSLDRLAVRAGCSRSAMADRLRRLAAAAAVAEEA